ncbi:MAG: fluoride efflux transporter CrcB [Planctomycetota bacterium]
MNRLFDYLLLGLAGGVGTLLRAGCVTLAVRLAGAESGWAPQAATLAVNVIGSFAFGSLFALAQSRPLLSSAQQACLFVGLLGGFTTYSSFAFQTVELAQNGRAVAAAAYVAATTALAVGAAWLGLRLFS